MNILLSNTFSYKSNQKNIKTFYNQPRGLKSYFSYTSIWHFVSMSVELGKRHRIEGLLWRCHADKPLYFSLVMYDKLSRWESVANFIRQIIFLSCLNPETITISILVWNKVTNCHKTYWLNSLSCMKSTNRHSWICDTFPDSWRLYLTYMQVSCSLNKHRT